MQTPWYKRDAVKIPLLFAVIAGLVAGVVATVSVSGGSANPLRVNVGLIAFGVAFIVSLVVAAMLQMVEKPNDPELGQGSGVHRRAADIPGGAQNVPDPRAHHAHRPDHAPRAAEERPEARPEARPEDRAEDRAADRPEA